MSNNWFPKVSSKSDIYILDSFECNFSVDELFTLLNSNLAIELKDKVGNLSTSEGSGKFSARLLEVNNFIIKTDLTLVVEEFEKLKKELSKKVAISNKLKIYHPSKQWFIIKYNDKYLPCSICKKLYTIHNISNLEYRLDYFLDLIKISLSIIKTHNIELDLNPSNFAYEKDSPHKLYYLDDEFYETTELRSIGEFIVHRIRHENNISNEQWEVFSEKLCEVLNNSLSFYLEFAHVLNGLEEFSLSPRFFDKRDIIIKKIKDSLYNKNWKQKIIKDESNNKINIEAKNETEITKEKIVNNKKITCVLADVHANLPALESVIEESKKLGATDYIILGDIVGYGPFPNETIDLVRTLPNLIAVQGNHDYAIGNNNFDTGMSKLGLKTATWTVSQLNNEKLEWLKNLKNNYKFEKHMYIHGSILDERYFLAYIYEMSYEENLKKADEMNLNYVLFGHTHVPYIYYINKKNKMCYKQNPTNVQLVQDNNVFLVNPGSVGQPRDRINKASFAIIDENNNLSFHRVDYSIERAISEIKKIGIFPELINRLENGV